MIGTRLVAAVLTQPCAVEEPVDPRKPDVEHDRVGSPFANELLGLDHMVGLVYLDSLELECRAYELAEADVVVDDENAKLFHPCLRCGAGCFREASTRFHHG